MLRAASATSPPAFADVLPDPQTALFGVLLDADSAVDEQKLRRAAAAGIPSDVRPLVWRLLLGITAFHGIDGLSSEQGRTREYANLAADVGDDGDVSRRVRAVLKRSRSAYQPASTHEKRAGTTRQGSISGESCDGEDDDEQTPPLQGALPNGVVGAGGGNRKSDSYVRRGRHVKVLVIDRGIVSRFSRIVNVYLQGTGAGIEFHTDMVHICAPFVELMPNEADAFYGFHALMLRYQHMFTDEGLQEAVSQFITMFRTLHQDLYDHFVSEEFDINSWGRKWLRGLLVQQLPRHALLRLWDVYFANQGNGGLELHPYVCLVFIEHIKAELHDCDDGERITTLLGKLPAVDIDRVIAHAIAAREQIRERGIL